MPLPDGFGIELRVAGRGIGGKAPIFQLQSQRMVPDVRLKADGGQEAHHAVPKQKLERPERVGRGNEEDRREERNRVSPLHLAKAQGGVVAGAREGLRADQLADAIDTGDGHERQKRRRGAIGLEGTRGGLIGVGRKHAVREHVQHGGQLIEHVRGIRKPCRVAEAEGQRGGGHGGVGEQGIFAERARQQREEQVKLHLDRHRPQNHVQMGIGVGGGKEYVCKRKVGQKILPHFGGGSVLMLGQRHAEQHHKHAQQVAGQDAYGALFIERARGRRRRAGNRGARPREEEQKAAQRQKRLHQHIAAAHQPVEILTENGRVEP